MCLCVFVFLCVSLCFCVFLCFLQIWVFFSDFWVKGAVCERAKKVLSPGALKRTFSPSHPPPPCEGSGALKPLCGHKKLPHCEWTKKKKKGPPARLFSISLGSFSSSLSFFPASLSFFLRNGPFLLLFLLLPSSPSFFSSPSAAAASSSQQQQAAAAAAASSSNQQQGPTGQSTEISYETHKNNRSAQQPAEAHQRNNNMHNLYLEPKWLAKNCN